MDSVGHIEATSKVSVTGTAPLQTAFVAGGTGASANRRIKYRLCTDDVIHVAVNIDAAATTGMRLPKDSVTVIELFGGDFLSWIVGAGVASANLWITPISG